MSESSRVWTSWFLGAIVACAGVACGSSSAENDEDGSGNSESSSGTSADASTSAIGADASPGSPGAGVGADHEETSDYEWSASDEVLVQLQNTTIITDLTRAAVNGTTVTIQTPGTYRVQGTLDDGRIVVQTAGLVRVILDGAHVFCSTSAPLDVEQADKAVVVVATDSSLEDGATYVLPEGTDEPNAALFSKSNLTVYGTGGTLTVDARYNDGIGAKDGLVLRDAKLVVTATDDAIRGKDYVVVRGATLDLTADGDGIKADNEDDATLGFVSFESGTLNVTAAGDGVQAETALSFSGGTATVKAGGGATATLADDASAKGLKANTTLTISGGVLMVDSADDALHSDVDAVIAGGASTLGSGDQGIKVGDEGALAITGGSVDITRSTEGLSGGVMSITGGTTRIVASDDGVSVSRGTEANGDDGSRLSIEGGMLVVDATGDGIDVNGSATMSGGTVIVHGPTANNNAPLDYNGTFLVTGGVLVAAGSSSMAQAPSAASTQGAVLVRFVASQAAGSLIHLQDTAGTTLFTFAPRKQYQSILFSAPTLAIGTAYSLYLGGSVTGTASDGLTTDGEYTPGTLNQTFTTSGAVTTLGSGGGGPGGGR